MPSTRQRKVQESVPSLPGAIPAKSVRAVDLDRSIASANRLSASLIGMDWLTLRDVYLPGFSLAVLAFRYQRTSWALGRKDASNIFSISTHNDA